MDKQKIEAGARLILEGIGEDLEREGIRKTPRRVAEMYAELFKDIDRRPEEEIKTIFYEENYDEMVVLRNIPFHSICEHHLLPFIGRADIVYIPRENRIVGVSKLARVMQIAASRPQLQERLTAQVADALVERLDPYGVLVRIEAEHLCMTIRGIKKPGSQLVTSAIRGLFRTNQASRDEALAWIIGDSKAARSQ
ncbi:MAG: GTP cyclohydrolase I FolE [Candidatus Bipolaricaulia bacterium]